MIKAVEIAEKFGTSDAFEIARKCGVSVIYESWHPVTVGEFDRKNRAIHVNLRAAEKNIDFEKIVAHELGHFFALDLKLDKSAEENFAHEFAENLLKINKQVLEKSKVKR